MVEPFVWSDGDRSVQFGGDLAAGVAAVATQRDVIVLTTQRAAPFAERLAPDAHDRLLVPPGPVPEVAAALLSPLDAQSPRRDTLLIAYGGGRVIDTAKAVAAARGIRDIAAIPTSLSGAEMTRGHRHAHGTASATPRMRPTFVLSDPATMTSLPPSALAASAANATAHAVGALTNSGDDRVAALLAEAAFAHLAAAYDHVPPQADTLALGALLAGAALDRTGLGFHHAAAQSLVRASGLSHALVHAALLPHTITALTRRGLIKRELAARQRELADLLADRADADALRESSIDPETLTAAAATAVRRPEMRQMPSPPIAEEIQALYRAITA